MSNPTYDHHGGSAPSRDHDYSTAETPVRLPDLDKVRAMASAVARDQMARPIRALGLPLICRLILHRAELHTVGDLVRVDHETLSQVDLMTPEWMNEIERSLASWGLRLGSN